jgi:molybdopterin synthase sulfur carrier subunit
MVSVSLHYWAGARAAAGLETETVSAGSVAEAIRAVVARRQDARFALIIKASSVLINGLAAHEQDLERPLSASVRVEILPPFAGGG